jgi:hypothetical protein
MVDLSILGDVLIGLAVLEAGAADMYGELTANLIRIHGASR